MTDASAGGKRLRRLAADSGIYATGSMIGQLSSLITFPLYTRALGVDGYGLFALLMALLSVGRSVLIFGMNTALIRFYVGGDEKERARVIGSALGFTGFIVVAASVLAGFFPGQVASVALGKSGGVQPAVAAALYVLATDVTIEMVLALARAKQAPKLYVIANTVRTVVTVVGVVAAVAVHGGIVAVFVAMVAGNLVGMAIVAWRFRRELTLRLDVAHLRAMLVFGAGLVPANLAAWALDVGDRYVLERFTTLTSVGLYSAAYRVGSLITALLVIPFNTAFLPAMLDAVKTGHGNEFVSRTARYYSGLFGISVVGIAAFAQEFLLLLAGAKYVSAASVVGPVAFGCALAGAVSVFGPGIIAEGKTHISAAIFLTAAVANIAGNIIVVPKVGMIGAAYVTLGTYLILGVVYVWASQRVFPVELDLRGMLIAFGIVATTVAAMQVIYASSLSEPVSLAIRFVIALVALTLFFVGNVISVRELTTVVSAIWERMPFARRSAS